MCPGKLGPSGSHTMFALPSTAPAFCSDVYRQALEAPAKAGVCVGPTVSIQGHTVFPADLRRTPVSFYILFARRDHLASQYTR